MKNIGPWGNTVRRMLDCFVIVWPLLFVLAVMALLLRSLGTGTAPDVLAWPAIKKLAQENVNEPELSVHLRIVSYYSVFSFSVGLFLLLNSLIFFVKVRAVNPGTDRGRSAHRIAGLGVFLRGIALFFMSVWLVKLVAIDPKDAWPLFDEDIVLLTFTICAVADFSILVSLLIESGISKLMKSRELVGALFYIDVPTIIGVGVITYYAPDLLKTANTPDMMFKAVAGGAMIIHIVSSQLILSFLIAEEKLDIFLGSRRKAGSRTLTSAPPSPLPAQSPVAHPS